MAGWEYCSLDRFYKTLTFFKTTGSVTTPIKKDRAKGDTDDVAALARTIAELGANGWELVSVSVGGTAGENLFFKRPLS